jgi:hypothetical protein
MVQDSFLYCWTNKANGKLYIGTHKGTMDDGYVCSSRIMLEEYLNNPSVFTRSIIATGSYKDMIGLETSILKSVDAARNICFYNMHNGDGKFFNKGHSENTKTKLKIARNKRTDKPRLGKKLSEEGRLKASESAKNRSTTLEGKEHLSKAGKISAEKRKNNLLYKQYLSQKTKELWEKRRLGLLPWPKNMRSK